MNDFEYRTSTEGLSPASLQGGFFEGWSDAPGPETHLKILENSDHVVLAVYKGEVIGFITALSDGVLSAFITLLEVLPEYQGRGIGQSLMNQIMEEIGDIYMVDLVCDANLSRFYAELGFATTTGMSRRDYRMQSGRPI